MDLNTNCKGHVDFMKSVLDKIDECESREEFENYYDILIRSTESLYKMKVTDLVIKEVATNKEDRLCQC